MILVTGADGLIGSWLRFIYPKDTLGFSHKDLDITDDWRVHEVLHEVQPDVVINCAGIVKSRHNANPVTRHEVNAEAPHILAKTCDMVGARLIQLSTDCVFKGSRGNYTEDSPPDADDNYGWTKLQGEVTYSPHLTVRCSFVGWPDPAQHSLLAWFKSTKGEYTEGHSNVLWNGLTVVSLARYLMELAYSRSTGVMHLHGQTITKYDLLLTVREVYGWQDVPIVIPIPFPVLDRTLASVRTDVPILPSTTNFKEQVIEMHKYEKRYNKWVEGL